MFLTAEEALEGKGREGGIDMQMGWVTYEIERQASILFKCKEREGKQTMQGMAWQGMA